MKKVAIIRCEKNMDRCPMTNGLKCLAGAKEGFGIYEDCQLVGVFTCRCPGDKAVDLAKILKAKGAEAVHFCTCTFAAKTEEGWVAKEGGFCDNIDRILGQVSKQAGITCVKGTAHLPSGYRTEIWFSSGAEALGSGAD